MKHRTLLILLAFLASTLLSAQSNDSIRNAIMNQRDTDMQLLTKGRSLIIEQLNKGDIVGMRDTKNFLVDEMEDAYKVFTIGEYWLLSLWTEDYSTVLFESEEFAREFPMRFNSATPTRFLTTAMLRMIAENDGLHEKLGIKSAESYIPLSVYIDEAELEKDEKEFLKLLLFSMVFTPDNPEDEAMKEVNERATTFLDAYQESDHAEYARRFIRYEYAVGNWGAGYELALGYGNAFGELQNNFRGGFALGFAFELLYKQAHFNVRFNIVSSKTRNDITMNRITWPAGTMGNFFTADFSAQYPLYKSRAIKLMPFVGVGAVGIGPVEKVKKDYPEMENFKELSAFSYLAGMDFRFNFWDKEVNLAHDGGLYLNLRYSYYFPNYSKKHDFLNGNLHLITLGIGGFGRPMKRKL